MNSYGGGQGSGKSRPNCDLTIALYLLNGNIDLIHLKDWSTSLSLSFVRLIEA